MGSVDRQKRIEALEAEVFGNERAFLGMVRGINPEAPALYMATSAIEARQKVHAHASALL